MIEFRVNHPGKDSPATFNGWLDALYEFQRHVACGEWCDVFVQEDGELWRKVALFPGVQ